jgi:hypothetical protein
MSKQLQGRGIIIPPVVFIGTSKYVKRWLFIKHGYASLLVSEEEIYGSSPLLMTPSGSEENSEAIHILLSKKIDQSALKKLFNVPDLKEDIKLNFDTTDMRLLDANR